MNSSKNRNPVKKLLAILLLVFVLSGCSLEPYRYAGETRSEAKAIANQWLLKHLDHPGFWKQNGPETESHVLNRDAWKFMFIRPDKNDFLCLYVWYDDYTNKDYSVQGGC